MTDDGGTRFPIISALESMSKFNDDNDSVAPSIIQPSKDSYQDNLAENIDEEDHLIKENVRDRFRLVQITMLILGTCTLLPWNFFITASNYWMYKFRTVGEKIDYTKKNAQQAMFESYLTVASTVSLSFFLFLNTIFGHRIRQEIRVLGALLFIVMLMILTTAFVKIDTDGWQNDFMALTLVTVVLINMATAIFQGALGGIASMLPSNCMNALMNGQSLGGVFAALASVLTLLDPNVTTANAGLAYFLISIVVSLFTFISYCLLLKKSAFFRYHTKRHVTHEHVTGSSASIIVVFKKIWPYCIPSWFVLTSTLAVFPAVLANSVSKHYSEHSLWTKTLYVPVVIFLLFNVSDFVGRSVSLLISWPKLGSRWLYILSLLRVVLPVLLLFCNRKPRHGLPILFDEDYDLIILMIMLGLTNGYFLTLSMMYAPRIVTKEEQEVCGTMMATFAGTGVMCGTLVGIALVHTV